MSRVAISLTAQDSALKAVIIYDDFASAAGANVALHNSARNGSFSVQWDVRLWRIDMLRYPSTAEDSLTDALDAHLIVIAGGSTQSLPLWLKDWLEHWAKCRQIKEAALALFGVEHAGILAVSALREFSSVASRHGLGLIVDDGRNGEDQSQFIEHSLEGYKLLPAETVPPILEAQIHTFHPRWGINE